MNINIPNRILSILWIILSIIIFYNVNTYTDSTHDFFTAMACLSYVLTLYTWIHAGNRLFSIFFVFVLYSLFSNLGQSFLYSFTEFPLFISIYDKFDFNSICYMLKFQYLCAAGLNLGTSLYVDKYGNSISLNVISEYYRNHTPKYSSKQIQNILDFIMYVCFIVIFGYTVYQLLLRQSISYSELYETRELVSEYYSFGAIALGILSIIRKRHVKFVYFSWIWFFLAFFLAGTRSMGIIYVGALVFCMPITYPQFFKKKYLAFWIIGLIIGFFFINIISSARQNSIGFESIFDSTDLLFGLFSSINEMGISETPTMITIAEVQRTQIYNQTLIYNILMGFIPSGILNLFVPEGWAVMLGSWVNEVSNTEGTQWGYSWISESYLNFYELGWIFTVVYGYFIAFAENYSMKKIMQGRYLLAICLLSILCKQIFFARGQLNLVATFLKPSVYIFYVCLLFGNRIDNNK